MVDDKTNPKLLKGKHIFIVEDNLENRVVYNMTLGKHGAIVTFERWGRDTLSHMRLISEIDLIILDLMLPLGVSGFDIYDEIRAVSKYAEIPIVAVSAMEPNIAMPKAQSKGFQGFIVKPIDHRLFAKQLATILAGEQLWYAGERL